MDICSWLAFNVLSVLHFSFTFLALILGLHTPENMDFWLHRFKWPRVVLTERLFCRTEKPLIRMNQCLPPGWGFIHKMSPVRLRRSIIDSFGGSSHIDLRYHLCRHACSRFRPRSILFHSAGRLQHYQLWDCQSCQTPHYSMSSQSHIHINVMKLCRTGKLSSGHHLLKGQWQTMDLR